MRLSTHYMNPYKTKAY